MPYPDERSHSRRVGALSLDRQERRREKGEGGRCLPGAAAPSGGTASPGPPAGCRPPRCGAGTPPPPPAAAAAPAPAGPPAAGTAPPAGADPGPTVCAGGGGHYCGAGIFVCRRGPRPTGEVQPAAPPVLGKPVLGTPEKFAGANCEIIEMGNQKWRNGIWVSLLNAFGWEIPTRVNLGFLPVVG